MFLRVRESLCSGFFVQGPKVMGKELESLRFGGVVLLL